MRLVGLDLRLVLSAQHERIVRNDSAIAIGPLPLQLNADALAAALRSLPVLVHEFPDDTLGISYQHRLLAAPRNRAHPSNTLRPGGSAA